MLHTTSHKTSLPPPLLPGLSLVSPEEPPISLTPMQRQAWSLALSSLNPAQHAVVTAETTGNLAVLAGAGTGKTRVLTFRIAWLIHQGADPRRIMAMTFTNKAAREIKERLVELLGPQAHGLRTGTFHSLGLRWIGQFGSVLGIPKSPQCLDADDCLALVRRLMKADPHWAAMEIKPVEALAGMAKWKARCHQAGHATGQWPGLSPIGLYRPAGYIEQPVEPVARLYLAYEQEKALNGVIDFDDLILLPNRIFAQHPERLAKAQNGLDFILTDEFQDTDQNQYQLLEFLSDRWKGAQVSVVGDDDQSLYSWRGATTDIFPRYITDSKAALYKLEENYRCSPVILEAANAVIAHNEERLGKKLWTRKAERTPLEFAAFQDSQDEARQISLRIQALIRSGRSPADIVILYRKNRFSSDLEKALLKARVPYQVYGGTEYYRRAEVKDALAYLRLIANPNDDLAFRRIVNVPRRGIGDGKLEKLAEYAKRYGCSLLEASRSYRDETLAGFTRLIDKWQGLSTDLEVLVQAVLTESGLHDWYQHGQKSAKAQGAVSSLNIDREKGEAQAERLAALPSYAKSFMETRPTHGADPDAPAPSTPLAEFLSETVLETDATADKEVASVSLMTIHKAKGLEFPVVFLMGLEQGEFPSGNAPIEEERRLFYVGLTRGKDLVVLSRARRRFQFGQMGDATDVSEFVREIPTALRTPVTGRRQLFG